MTKQPLREKFTELVEKAFPDSFVEGKFVGNSTVPQTIMAKTLGYSSSAMSDLLNDKNKGSKAYLGAIKRLEDYIRITSLEEEIGELKAQFVSDKEPEEKKIGKPKRGLYVLVALASLLALSSLIMMLFRPGNSFGGENSNGQTRCVLDDKDVEAYIRNSGSVNSERIALIGLLKNLSFREKKNREASDSLALIRISKREVFNIVREGRVNMQISCYTLYGQPVQDLMAIAQPSSMDQLFTISDSLLTFSKGKPENMSVYDEAFYDVRHHLLSPTEDAEVLAEAIKTVVESVQQVQLEHVADYLSAQRKQAHN